MFKNPRRYLTILFIVSAILFLLDRANVFSSISALGNNLIVRPIVTTGTKVYNGSVSFFESIFSLKKFLADFSQLEEERNLYRGKFFELQAIKDENNLLRQALSQDARPEEMSLVLANIVSFDPLRSSQSLTLNKGENDGIKKGQAVILAGRVLMGRIQETDQTTSRVLLINSEASRITSTLEGSGSRAVIYGSASGALILDLVLKEAGPREGEIVLTSGLGGDLPPNLLIGEISKVINEETAAFARAVVRPFFKVSDVTQVFIITSF